MRFLCGMGLGYIEYLRGFGLKDEDRFGIFL